MTFLFNMFLKSHNLFVLLFFITLLNIVTISHAGIKQASPCLELPKQIETIKKEIDINQTRYDQLASLLDVGPTLETPLKALLEVDLTDNEAVTLKLKTLKQAKDNTPLGSGFLNPVSSTDISQCTAYKQYTDLLSQLKDLESKNTELSITILEQSTETRLNLINTEKNLNSSRGQIKELEAAERKLGEKRADATRNLSEAKETLETSTNEIAKKLAAERIILESFRQTLAKKQEESVGKFKTQAEERRLLAQRILNYKEVLSTVDDVQKLENVYLDLIQDWRNTVDTSSSLLFFLKTQNTELPPLPRYPDTLLSSAVNNQDAIEYTRIYEAEKKGLNEFKVQEKNRLTERLIARDTLLRDITSLRSTYIEYFLKFNNNKPFEWSAYLLADIGREIQLVSYKFSYFIMTTAQALHVYWDDTKQIPFEQKIKLARESARLFWLAVYLSLLAFILKHHKKWLHRIHSYVTSDTDHSIYDRLFYLLRKYEKFIPPSLLLIGLKLFESQIKDSFLVSVLDAFPYLYYFVAYQFFLVIFDSLLGFISNRAIYANINIKDKARSTGLWLGRCFFTVSILKMAAEQSVGRAITYSYVQTSLGIFFIFVFMLTAYFWRSELQKVINDGEHITLSPRLSVILKGPLALIFSLPLALIITVIQLIRLISKWGQRLEGVKKISTLLFKRQLLKHLDQDDDDNDNILPESYTNLFTLNSLSDAQLWVTFDSEFEDLLYAPMNKWLSDDNAEKTVAVYGDKGVGKSSLAFHIQHSFSSFTFIRVSVPPKLIDEANVVTFVGNIFGWKGITNIDILAGKLEELTQKAIIILDDCQNLFLGRMDGFEGYKTFTSLLNRNIKNVFWYTFFNNYSWRFLNEISGRNKFFRTILRLPLWDEEQIKALILKRHNLSGYQLDFQKIGFNPYEIREDDGELNEIESKFFRLLWEHSKGNPRVAIDTWLRSLKKSAPNLLSVTLFKTQPIERLDELSDDVHFILAAILKHENLTLQETVDVTSLSEAVCDYALSIGREFGILSYDANERHRLTPQWQYPVINYLRKKNFIYGS